MERLGTVGLTPCGKSDLFNAVIGGAAPVVAPPHSPGETGDHEVVAGDMLEIRFNL